MIVVQYVPCSEDEQGHLQCRGHTVGCDGHFELFGPL